MARGNNQLGFDGDRIPGSGVATIPRKSLKKFSIFPGPGKYSKTEPGKFWNLM